jgi:hypothetical protein
MNCPDCGYEIDELNESQPVCPRCGADPYDPNSSRDPLDDPMVELFEDPASKLIN